jgi:hypothetical protein
VTLFGKRSRSRYDDSGELGDGLVLKHVADRKAEAGLASASNNLDAKNGVASQLEEVVINANGMTTKSVGPDTNKVCFDGVGGRTGLCE